MPNIVSDIIVSPATVFHAPVGELPPADTVPAGTAWGGQWQTVGLMKETLKANYEFDELDVEVEQSLAPVKRVKTKENLTLETVLAELFLDGLQLGMEGTVTDTAAGVGQPGKEELSVGGAASLSERAWGFEGSYTDEDGSVFPVRMFVWKATAKINGELELSKEDYTGTPLQIKALADLTKAIGQRLFKIVKILKPATA